MRLGRLARAWRQVAAALELPVVMARCGLLRPGSPVKIIRQLAALKQWGTTLAGSFIAAAAREPDRPVIIDESGTFSYAEVDARTTRLALALRAGRGPQDAPPRVALLCRNHRGLVESIIACGKLGSDAVLLNTGLATEQLVAILNEQRIDVLIADAEFEALLVAAPGTIRKLTADGLDEAVKAAPDGELEPPGRPGGRTIVLSSGTGDRPKGAERPPRPGLRPLAALASRIPLRVRDTILIEAPIFHTWGYAALQLAFALRGTIVLHRRYEPVETLAAIERHRCDVLIAVPVMLQRLLELPVAVRKRHELSSLRVAASSGSALPGGLATGFMDAFGDLLYNLYGSTEASWVSIATPADLWDRPRTAGRPPRGTIMAILDPDGEPVPRGRTGRIFVSNALLFDGYSNGYSNGNSNGHSGGDSNGYSGGYSREIRHGLQSLGDIGHVDAEGRLYVEGSDDDMVISGGENIFPGEVEDVLARLPEVREVAVLGVADTRLGQRLAAYVVVRAGERLDGDTVRDCVRQRFARFAVPRDVYFLDELPRNATGKVLRRALPALVGTA